ncbi:hypothetical protein F4Y59_03325 [Candidatus Poribacteria bacterium]|nr:hypothetical protein [Candidatus Poribacteria bacterium]MYK19857.1 hypothetical protein [Candidatus Poribacteria bacterium]
MQLPNLTHDQIQDRCTARSFTRGEEYFDIGMIGNPILHGWTLSATCEGTEEYPYHVSVELMPTGIADADCSCPYDWGGDCKHIVALLLTYVDTPEVIYSLDTLLTALAEKPKETLLRVISELLKRSPELVPVAKFYADIPEEPEVEIEPIPPELSVYATVIEEVPDIAPVSPTHAPTASATVTTYREQVDRLFGNGFLEQQQLQQVLTQLEGLVAHAESLARTGETEFALSVLHAVIHQSITRYPDTLQRDELPRFVKKCTKVFTNIATAAQASDATDLNTGTMPAPLFEHCRMLLQLSFNAAEVFVPLLTGLLEQVCVAQETSELQVIIEQSLDESPDRSAHVQLLLALYLDAGKTQQYLRLAQEEGEAYRLIYALFVYQQSAVAWRTLEKFPLSIDEYTRLLQSPIATGIPGFADKLIARIKDHQPNTAITLYQRLIEQSIHARKREAYEKVLADLTALSGIYQDLGQEDQWTVYLEDLRKQHSRKRLLLQIIAEI